MKGAYIGAGLQYFVYKISDTRVRKVPAHTWHQMMLCVSWGYRNPFEIFEKIQEVNELAKLSMQGLKVRAAHLPAALLGNPTFGSGLDYEQDFVTQVGEYLTTHSLDENKKIFDLYISNMIELWEYGIGDEVFNFTINNGVTDDGRVILTDLGEVTFLKDDIAQLVADKLWAGQQSFTRLKKSNPEFSVYIEKEMEAKVTPAVLDAHWGIRM